MMGAKYLKMVKWKLHATKQRSPDEIRVWQLPLNEWSHLLAYPTKENENRPSLMASSSTPAIFIVLHISMNVAKYA